MNQSLSSSQLISTMVVIPVMPLSSVGVLGPGRCLVVSRFGTCYPWSLEGPAFQTSPVIYLMVRYVPHSPLAISFQAGRSIRQILVLWCYPFEIRRSSTGKSNSDGHFLGHKIICSRYQNLLEQRIILSVPATLECRVRVVCTET